MDKTRYSIPPTFHVQVWDNDIFTPNDFIGKFIFIRDHSFSTYAKFPEKLRFCFHLILTRTCVYPEVRNVSFSENFAYILNESSLRQKSFCE